MSRRSEWRRTRWRWEKRLRVMFDWTVDLLFLPPLVQLKVGPAALKPDYASAAQTLNGETNSRDAAALIASPVDRADHPSDSLRT